MPVRPWSGARGKPGIRSPGDRRSRRAPARARDRRRTAPARPDPPDSRRATSELPAGGLSDIGRRRSRQGGNHRELGAGRSHSPRTPRYQETRRKGEYQEESDREPRPHPGTECGAPDRGRLLMLSEELEIEERQARSLGSPAHSSPYPRKRSASLSGGRLSRRLGRLWSRRRESTGASKSADRL